MQIKNIEENFFAVSRYWGSLNKSIRNFGSTWAMNTGVNISDINWVWNEEPLNSNDISDIEFIKELYQKINLRFWWWVYPCGQSVETTHILQNAGLRLITSVPCMAANLINFYSEPSISENLKVSQVKNKNDLFLWRETSFDGFEMHQRARKQYGDFVASLDIQPSSKQKIFLAYLKGVPVATSLLFTHANTAGIYYVSTLPAFRNKGFGLEITKAAMRAAKEAGFQEIILQATPLGATVYQRAGFKEYCRADIYILPRS